MTPSLDEWLQYVESVHPRSIELGLDRVRRVAQRLDVLPPAPLSIIIAGTNGKGSTAVAAEALGMAAGLRVGTTLSPHVHRFNERVRLQGRPMEDEPLARLFDRVDDARGEDSLTYFEYSALVALLAFKQARVDLGVLEVGLRGRLDAFNIVDADIAVVTSIGLDHQDWLGSDLEQIGREKAGVFRSGHPVVVGAVTESVIEAAHNLGCPISRLGSEFEIRESPLKWTWRRPGHADLQIPRCNLAPANCALAATALADRLQLTDTAIAEALSELTLTGRMEHWRIGTVQVIVDAVKGTLDETPPELVADLMEYGIVLAGGGALLQGLAQRLQDETRMHVYVADNPLTAVVMGTGMILEKPEFYRETLTSMQRKSTIR